MLTRAHILIGLVVSCAMGCKPSEPPKPAAPPPPQPSADWLAGRLPPERAQGTPKPGGTFVLRVSTEPLGLTRLHDRQSDGVMVRYTVGPLYETLARVNHVASDGALQPLLAESWEESADHATLTVHLRKGVTFHDGSAFTARDVKAVLGAILDPKNPTASLRSTLGEVRSVEARDAATVVVSWEAPTFLSTRTLLGGVPMLPAKALEGDFDTLAIHRAPIGTGPFRFVQWKPGESLTFARNERYWGKKAWLDGVSVRFVKEEAVAMQLWERGTFDLMTRIPPTVWRGLETPSEGTRWAIEQYDRIAAPENNYGWIGWNEARPFFADARVRRALAMLYPAAVVARTVDLGLEERTTCPFFSGSRACDGSIQPLPQDSAKAAALLDEAGWKDSNGDGIRDRDGTPFSFRFLTSPHSVKQGRVLPMLQEELRRVGVEMSIERADASVYVSRLRDHDFDAAMLSWSSLDAVQDQFQVFHSSQAKGGSNYVSYANPEVDALLEQIRRTFDDDERTRLERKLHAALFADQVYLFLTTRPSLDAAKKDVRGLVPSPAWYDLSAVWLER